MTDLEALYETIVQQPGEDTPRLMYADALDERNELGDQERAKFIRASIELTQIGPPRFRVEGNFRRCGRNLFFIDADADGLKVGQRVDVLLFVNATGRWEKEIHGLVIENIGPADVSGARTLRLRKDEFAGPYPQQRVTELNKICAKSCNGWMSWIRLPHCFALSPLGSKHPSDYYCSLWTPLLFGALSGDMAVRIRRGFASEVICSYRVWEAYGGVFSRCNPISRVELLDSPESEVNRISNTESIFNLLPPNDGIYITMSDKDYDSYGEGDEPEDEIDRRLLSKRWPKVCEWQTNCRENSLRIPRSFGRNVGGPYSDDLIEGS